MNEKTDEKANVVIDFLKKEKQEMDRDLLTKVEIRKIFLREINDSIEYNMRELHVALLVFNNFAYKQLNVEKPNIIEDKNFDDQFDIDECGNPFIVSMLMGLQVVTNAFYALMELDTVKWQLLHPEERAKTAFERKRDEWLEANNIDKNYFEEFVDNK